MKNSLYMMNIWEIIFYGADSCLKPPAGSRLFLSDIVPSLFGGLNV